jgi:opacity protein-like surface antigen
LWSARLEYDYYQFGNGSVLMSDSTNMFSGPVNVKQSVQIVKAGLNFHVWWGP